MAEFGEGAPTIRAAVASRREVIRAAHHLRQAAKAARHCVDGPREDLERRAREADECLADLRAAVTGEERDHRPRRALSENARERLGLMLKLAAKLTACDLAIDDVRSTFRSRHVSTLSRGFGEQLATAAFDVHTVVSFPAADPISQAFTLTQQATRNSSAFTKGCLKAAKYALAPSPVGLINDATAILGEAVYQSHIDDLVELNGRLGLVAASPRQRVRRVKLARAEPSASVKTGCVHAVETCPRPSHPTAAARPLTNTTRAPSHPAVRF
ncbi:hypothetical protein [Streptomyces sp. NPDC050534]|uniref:hypothetical protein n=1 Tax=Streptomyces sp. NPDC050534 TaxID=3365625 RepID=UPI0037AC2F03